MISHMEIILGYTNSRNLISAFIIYNSISDSGPGSKVSSVNFSATVGAYAVHSRLVAAINRSGTFLMDFLKYVKRKCNYKRIKTILRHSVT